MTEKSSIKEANQKVKAFIQSLDQYTSAEDKLQHMLDFMHKELSHGQLQPINRFWKMRQYCLEQFKEDLYLSKRSQYWEKYRQFVAELNRMKSLIHEKTVEDFSEMTKAIEIIEDHISQYEKTLKTFPLIEIPKNCPLLQKHAAYYKKTQQELDFVNSYAKQLNGLKQELIVLDIAYRDKQTHLEKIHKLSDVVFPKRRDLIAEISKKYSDDVFAFIQSNFEKKELKLPLFALKDQIKAYQGFAKTISLNVNAFSTTREKLSGCWDQIRLFEKEQKKLKEQQKVQCSENEVRIKQKIQELQESKASLGKNEFNQKIHQIDASIKKEELQKTQRKKLKELLFEIDENNAVKDDSTKQDELYQQLHQDLVELIEAEGEKDYFDLLERYKECEQLAVEQKLIEAYQGKLYRLFSSLKDKLSNKLLQEFEKGSDESYEAEIENFKLSLKKDIEKYRKALNASNQSIEKAMLFNEILTQAKHRLSEFEEQVQTKLTAE